MVNSSNFIHLYISVKSTFQHIWILGARLIKMRYFSRSYIYRGMVHLLARQKRMINAINSARIKIKCRKRKNWRITWKYTAQHMSQHIHTRKNYTKNTNGLSCWCKILLSLYCCYTAGNPFLSEEIEKSVAFCWADAAIPTVYCMAFYRRTHKKFKI